VDGVGEGVGRGQKAFESAINEFGAGVEQVFYFGIHLVLMINEHTGQALAGLSLILGLADASVEFGNSSRLT
jgi:hypothetical protein